MKKINVLSLFLLFTFVLSAETIRLDELKVTTKGTTGWGAMKKGRSIDGNPLTLKGQVYQYGIGTHAPGRIDIKLNKNATRFTCVVGIDDETNASKINEGVAGYKVINYSNQKETVVQEGIIRRVDAHAVEIDVDVTGWEYLSLECTESNEQNWSDHVDWCDAQITYNKDGEVPYAVTYQEMMSSKLELLCALKYYSLPNTRMMHRLACNKKEAIITVSDLPQGLEYNAGRKAVDGKIQKEGTYTYHVTLTTDDNTITEQITVVVSSDLISPTPLMGWTSWNAFQNNIDENVLTQTADLLVSTGLKDVGFKYLLVDDVWHSSKRLADGKPTYNAEKFPKGMKYLTDYAHSKGLKIGTYSDAAEKTCAGEYGSFGYEKIDAQQYADWGFDLLKYDYCFAPSEVDVAKERYKTMKEALKSTGREFYYYVCEWGKLKPWLWASSSGGHAWRVSWDSRDTWDHGQYDTEHCGAIQIIDVMKPLFRYSGPNRFNDADMMCVGLYGQGGEASTHLGANGMTDTEYQSQFSMWAVFASPLVLSFDLSKMNEATKRILTNKEIIAVNQDPMGQQAECVYSHGGKEVYLKDMENGDVVVALLNRNSTTTTIKIGLDKLFLKDDKYVVRDLWKQEDIATVTDKVSATVKSHETKVYRLRKKVDNAVNSFTVDNSNIQVIQQNKKLNVKIKGFDNEAQAQIINVGGKAILRKKVKANSFSIDISNLSKGVYLLEVTDDNKSENQKIIIK